jgi:hypothetical protein
MVAETSRGRGIDFLPAVGFDAMRTLSKTIVALGLVALMAGPALAQQRRGGGGGRGFFGGGNIGWLLSNASVQQELKLDATQIEKAKEVAEKAREKFTASRESLQSLQGDERFKKMAELNKEVNEEVNKSVGAFLSKDQIHRLHQIHHQVQGAQAFTEEHLQAKLKLSGAQKADIQAIATQSRDKMRAIFQETQGDREAAMAKTAELRKETLAKIESKLTAEQKTAYKEMLGAPFEIKYEGRPGGGGR